MKCENCNVKINPEFGYAIKNNQCPACGKSIMQPIKLASFVSLRALLESNINDKEVDIDHIAFLIISNFDIKQLFKEELKKGDTPGITKIDVIEKTQDPDLEYKNAQKKEAKSLLQKMRDEALNGALKERYGVEDDGILIPDGDINIYEVVSNEKKENSLNSIVSGIGGSFARSGQ